MYAQKKIRAIGVSNFQIHHLEALKKTAKIMPMVNQVECHPGLQQIPLHTYLKEHGIAIESYGPFMKGGIYETPFKEVLEAIANKHQKTIAQIVIAWGLHNDIIMIPKSSTKERIKENFLAQDITLDLEDLNQLKGLNRGKRVYTDPDNSPWGYNYEAS
jgi:methylglyoxal/glyoxal reductase